MTSVVASQESYGLAKQAASHSRLGDGRGIKSFVSGSYPSVSMVGGPRDSYPMTPVLTFHRKRL